MLILCQDLAQLSLIDLFEFGPDTDLAQNLVCSRVKFESFSVQVHLGIKEMEESMLYVVKALIFKISDLAKVGWRSLRTHLDGLLKYIESLRKVA